MTAASDAAELVRLCDGDDDLAYDYLHAWSTGYFNAEQAGAAVTDWLHDHVRNDADAMVLMGELV